MRQLKEALIGRKNATSASTRIDGKSFFVWPVMADFGYVNDHPHWIEMTLHDTKGNQAGKVYVFDKDQLMKDVRHFNESKTMIFVANISQNELIQRLEKYRVSAGSSSTEVLSNEKWVEAYLLYQFKNEYRREINGRE